MTINASRYGLITNEFRYKEAYSATIDSRYVKAREMEINSELDLGLVTGLLTDMFGVVGAARRRFMVHLIGTDFLNINSFAGQTPTYTFTSDDLGVSGLSVIVTRAVIDEDEGITSLELWG